MNARTQILRVTERFGGVNSECHREKAVAGVCLATGATGTANYSRRLTENYNKFPLIMAG